MRGLFLKQTLFSGMPNFFSIPVSIFCIPLLLQSLGLEQFGYLVIIVLFINQSNLFLFGLDKAFINSATKLNKKLIAIQFYSLLAICFFAAIIVFFIFYIILSAGLVTTPLLLAKNLLPIAIGFLLHLIWCLEKAFLIAREKFSWLGMLNFLHLSSAIYAPVFAIYALGFEAAFDTCILSWTITRLILLLLPINYFPKATVIFPLNINLSRKLIVRNLTYGKWIGANQVITMLYESGDRYLLSLTQPINSVALYSVPLQLSQKIAVLPQAMATVLYPKASRGEPLNANIIMLSALFLCTISLVFFTLNDQLMALWLRDNFTQKWATYHQSRSLQ